MTRTIPLCIVVLLIKYNSTLASDEQKGILNVLVSIWQLAEFASLAGGDAACGMGRLAADLSCV